MINLPELPINDEARTMLLQETGVRHIAITGVRLY